MIHLDRRQFLQVALAGAATSSLTPQSIGEETKKLTSDRVSLGDTGIETSRLAFGTGTHGFNGASDQTRLGMDQLTKLLCHAYDSGITFFDTADVYGSHTFVRNALKTIPREKIVIQSKIWWRFHRDPQKELDRFRKELNTDYIDTVLLHCVNEPDWPDKLERWRDVLSQAKEDGVVRAHGLSCHSIGAVKTAVKCDWVDVVLARINPVGSHMDGSPEKTAPILRKLHDSGKGVIGMKILGEGEIAGQRDTSLKFVLGLGCVDTMVIGFVKQEEIDDIIKRMDRHLNSS